MKRILPLMLLCCSLLATPAFAGSADLFSYDKQEIENEFESLTQLESYVKCNDGITLSKLVDSNSPMVSGIAFGSPYALSSFLDDAPLGVPSFWWGCCFGVAGIAVVYFVTEDDEETKSAFKGCVIGTLASAVLYWGIYIGVLGYTGFLF